jgi:subtilisin family serine protease
MTNLIKFLNQHRLSVTILIFALLMVTATVLVLLPKPLPSGPSAIGNTQTSPIAQITQSPELAVDPQIIAAKTDLQRKVIAASTPEERQAIIQTVNQMGGEIIAQKDSSVVVYLPKESETQVETALEAVGVTSDLEVDYPVFLASNPDWGVTRIEAVNVWPVTAGPGIIVAVIDTGVDYTHPELSGRYSGGYDFVNNDTDPMDDHGHGTHVAGIVAASTNGAGTIGVAHQANIMALKSLSADGGGYVSDVVDAVNWAANNGAQVINLSLGSSKDSRILRQAVDQAASQGIVIVAAAGNTNGGPLLYPAAYSSVIAVSATDSRDRFASFSSVGAELAAPGVSITSPVPGGRYATWSGTSMAAPHVAGTVALMLANGQSSIREHLRATALDLGDPGVDQYFGYGLVNSRAAALGEDSLAPIVSFISPPHQSIVNEVVGIEISAQDESLVTGVNLAINNQLVASWIQPPYTYAWDTTTYPDGTYTLIASATDDSDNTGEAQITITVSQSMVQDPTPTPAPSNTPKTKPTKAQGPSRRQNTESAPQETPLPAQNTIPEVSNVDERQQKPAPQTSTNDSSTEEPVTLESVEAESTSPGQSGNRPENRGKPGAVQGSTTSLSLWERLVLWLFK